MKYIIYCLFLLTTVSYSQTQRELIKDSCNCIEKIGENPDQGETKRLVMDCTLNAFKENRSYTEQVVKEFTGKNVIDGKDVFRYHQDVFHNILIDNCSKYKKIISEIHGTKADNSTVEKVGMKICNQLPNPLSESNIKSTVDRITLENQQGISETYADQNGNDYLKDLKEYLISNCRKYRQYILDKGN